MKTDKDELSVTIRIIITDKDYVTIFNLIKMVLCLRYDVYNNNIDMDFLNKVEVIKQYRQSVIEQFQKIKIRTWLQYMKGIQRFGMDNHLKSISKVCFQFH